MRTPTIDSQLSALPPFEGRELLIKQKQKVHDIVKEVIEAHELYRPQYDMIVDQWMNQNPVKIPGKLFSFCRDSLVYRIEGEDYQTTRSPAGILALKTVDCKHYAGYCAGILDAINRTGEYYYDWSYRFASYGALTFKPQHVFVTIDGEDGKSTWIDPVPEVPYFNSKDPAPVWQWDQKIAAMPLVRLSGISQQPPGPVGPRQVAQPPQPDRVITAWSGYDGLGGTDAWGTQAAWSALGPRLLTTKEQQDNNTILQAWKNRAAADTTAAAQGNDSFTYLQYQLLDAFGFPIINPSMNISQGGSSLPVAEWYSDWLQNMYPSIYQVAQQDQSFLKTQTGVIQQTLLSKSRGLTLPTILNTPLNSLTLLPLIRQGVATNNFTAAVNAANQILGVLQNSQTESPASITTASQNNPTGPVVATTTGNAILDFIEANPIPSLLILAGVGIGIYEIVKD